MWLRRLATTNPWPALLIGIAESTQTIAQQAFFGQEAPADLRGTAYGLLAFFAEQQLGFIGGALIEGGVACSQMAGQLAAGGDQPRRDGLGGLCRPVSLNIGQDDLGPTTGKGAGDAEANA
jgi:hypothetical protein